MGITYRPDDDLAFLQYCTEDDIRQLAKYLMFDDDGEKRVASEIADDPQFKQLEGQPNQWRQCWKLVAGELQHFAGDSIVNLFRRQGVLYREMLSDVCDKAKAKYDSKASAYDIENTLIERLVAQSWDSMSDAEKHKAMESMNLPDAIDSMPIVAIIKAISSGGKSSFEWSAWLATSARQFFGSAAAMGAGGAAALIGGRAVAAFAGPVAALAITIPMFSGAAYRVTIPAVIQIAYMRRKYEKEDRF
ncbi:DUF3944 domain-containing protein [Pseudomonas sp. SED1]|uniref:DUF3944 domain-containing protein n=1 Tax=Pseudomonas sp. SED1 TaxID=3056845 RepID=UPI00296FB4FB|nr:DUF3944 domain-containing protein [Pseudomonas sp. SED1]MDY0833880.1 DUF3944 domain-containing protein [Pseudomonas sp. SED1]